MPDNHLKPLTVGSLEFKNPVLLAPMAGITDFPFRRLARRFGAGFVISEMIASQALIRRNRKSFRMGNRAPEEFPLSIQLSGAVPDVMAEAGRIAESMGAAMIDINMGCPQRKIVKTGAGAALMRDERLAARIIKAVVSAVSIPVSVKIRLGWDRHSLNALGIAKMAEEYGASMITVHGRTRSQMFSGTADWHAIREVKKGVSIPVIANGDIRSAEDAESCLEVSGAHGIMIGRSALGRPWLFKQVSRYLTTGTHQKEPDIREQCATALEHLEGLLEFYGRTAGLLISRKHLGWYSKGLKGGALFRKAVNATDRPEKVRDLVLDFYEALSQQQQHHR